jgi:hypothetical protein
MLKRNARCTPDTYCTAGFSSHSLIKENTHMMNPSTWSQLLVPNTEAGNDAGEFMEHYPDTASVFQ